MNEYWKAFAVIMLAFFAVPIFLAVWTTWAKFIWEALT